MPSENGANTGQIIEIKGVVIDAVFPESLPEILSALEITMPRPDGSSGRSSSPRPSSPPSTSARAMPRSTGSARS